jgi:predicted nucleic acid binding AN1-type Zn finger protein
MIELSLFPKENEKDENSKIFTFNNITNIFKLKKVLSEKIKKSISDIFIYSVHAPNIHYENNFIINDNEKFYFKILSNKCAYCVKKSIMLTGDCIYCECHYCNIHRLPEFHACPEIEKCKSDSFQENYTKTINGKCVKSQIEII